MVKKQTAAMKDSAQGFGLLADPARLGSLAELAKGPKNVAALCKTLKVRQATMSYHLGLLRMGRLVNGVRRGRSVVYEANKANLKGLATTLAKLMPR